MQTYWNAKALNNKRLKLPCLFATLLYSNCFFTTLVAWCTNISCFYGGNPKKMFPFSKTYPHGLFQIVMFLFWFQNKTALHVKLCIFTNMLKIFMRNFKFLTEPGTSYFSRTFFPWRTHLGRIIPRHLIFFQQINSLKCRLLIYSHFKSLIETGIHCVANV